MNNLQIVSLVIVASMLSATVAVCERGTKIADDADKQIESWTWERDEEEFDQMLYDQGFELTVPIEQSGAPYDFLTLDDEYQIVLESLCADMELDFFLMASLMFSESSFRTSAKGDGGKSIGLFQINSVWWDYMDEKYGLDARDVYDNIEIGCIIFKDLLNKYETPEKAIQMYKCGEKRGKRLWNEGKKLSSIDGIIARAEEWASKK